MTLAPEPEPLEKPASGSVANIGDCEQAVQSECTEGILQDGRHGFGGVTPALVGRGKREAEFSLARITPCRAKSAVPDERTGWGKSYGELKPGARCSRGPVAKRLYKALCSRHREWAIPGLVSGDFGTTTVRRKRTGIDFPESADEEAF